MPPRRASTFHLPIEIMIVVKDLVKSESTRRQVPAWITDALNRHRAVARMQDAVFTDRVIPGKHQPYRERRYVFADARGKPMFYERRRDFEFLVRTEKDPKGRKKFVTQWRVDDEGRQTDKVRLGDDIARPIYRAREVKEADPSLPVFVAEGAFKCEVLRSMGLLATCCPEGAGRWLKVEPNYRKILHGRDVVVLPDNDKAGRDHAAQVAGDLAGKAKSVKVLALPRLREKGDVAGWDGTTDELLRLAAGCPEWSPGEGTDTAYDEAGDYRPRFRDTATLRRTAAPPAWAVEGMFFLGPPAVVGAAKKTMKTTLMVALAVALASGTKFLGRWAARRSKVAMLSGEWDDHAVSSAIDRICDAGGIDPDSLDVMWGFDLPQLSNARHVRQLVAELEAANREVLIVDPLYLALLAGAKDINAANLFDMGPLLRRLYVACRDAGVWLVLVHHSVKSLKPGEPMQLEHLSMAGVAEFARQWLLLNRREEYDASGRHKLHASFGNSGGVSGLATIDIDEGQLRPDFTGRRWGVEVTTGAGAACSMLGEKAAAKQQKVARQDHKDDKAVLDALAAAVNAGDRLWPAADGELCPTRRAVQTLSKLSRARYERAEFRLQQAGVVEVSPVMVTAGKGGQRAFDGLRRTNKTTPGEGPGD